MFPAPQNLENWLLFFIQHYSKLSLFKLLNIFLWHVCTRFTLHTLYEVLDTSVVNNIQTYRFLIFKTVLKVIFCSLSTPVPAEHSYF